MMDLRSTALDHDTLRTAGKDLLSLALIDVRNRTLAWASVFEGAPGDHVLRLSTELAPALAAEIDPPLWTLGHIAWFQEYWIGRNVQRNRGEAADPRAVRLASILPEADERYDAALGRAMRRRIAAGLPDLAATRQFLYESLETTLELLEGVPEENDDTLYFHRLALFYEEMQVEAFAVLAQSLGVAVPAGSVPRAAALASRPSLLYPATRWLLGSSRPGFAFDNEREAHPVPMPEFEIDAQAVSWAQYGEFVEDGGYDDASHWSEAGWNWVVRESRRTPRHVDQLRHGVLQHRFGQLARVPTGEPAVHVSWHEADAWCRWAGRRLPDEAEWEAAAIQGAMRGFRFGEVWEWTASRFGPYPGFVPGPWSTLSAPEFGSSMVLRGGSRATPRALRSARIRHFMPPERDDGFFGFRSCAA